MTKQTGISELIDAFNATVALQQRTLPTDGLGNKQLWKWRTRLDGGWPNKDVTVVPRMLVVTTEDWSHGSNKAAQNHLNKLGVWADDILRVSVDPGSELRAQRRYVRAVMDLSQTRYVLLLGAKPASFWRTDLPIASVRNRLHLWDARWFVWCMESPQAVYRAQSVGVPITGEWRDSLLRFVEHEVAGDTVEHALRNTCVKCADACHWYDLDGVAWCKAHRKQGETGRVKSRKYWVEQITGQETMEL